MPGSTLEEAQECSNQLLVGDRGSWVVRWEKAVSSDEMVPRLYLNPKGTYPPPLLDHPDHKELEQVLLVQVATEIDLAALQKEIATFSEEQRLARENDPEYQKYLELKAKFGG